VGPIAATPPINPEEGTPRTISRELNIYPRNKAHFGSSRAATEPALAEAREIAGWAVTRSGVSFSLHAAPARKFLSGKARQRATRAVSYPSLPACLIFSSVVLFLVSRPRRRRRLSRLVKGIFRASLLFLHPFRRRPQKLKCKAIERWKVLSIPGSFVPICSTVAR